MNNPHQVRAFNSLYIFPITEIGFETDGNVRLVLLNDVETNTRREAKTMKFLRQNGLSFTPDPMLSHVIQMHGAQDFFKAIVRTYSRPLLNLLHLILLKEASGDTPEIILASRDAPTDRFSCYEIHMLGDHFDADPLINAEIKAMVGFSASFGSMPRTLVFTAKTEIGIREALAREKERIEKDQFDFPQKTEAELIALLMTDKCDLSQGDPLANVNAPVFTVFEQNVLMDFFTENFESLELFCVERLHKKERHRETSRIVFNKKGEELLQTLQKALGIAENGFDVEERFGAVKNAANSL